MRFKATILNVNTFNKLTASLSSLGPIAWVRLDENEVRFTVIPEQGTQVWALLMKDVVFDQYTIQSANNNIINLEVPIVQLQRALRSALQASSASIRLTKKDNQPLLCLTINANSLRSGDGFNGPMVRDDVESFDNPQASMALNDSLHPETVITQDISVRVMTEATVSAVHEPKTREPDVHIQLPPLTQLKAVSDRFTRLSMTSKAGGSTNRFGPRLELSANMHGCLRLRVRADAMNISTLWTGLTNPELDPTQVEGGVEGVAGHASTRMKAFGTADGKTEEGWATVRIDGRDWGKVMSVGRLAGRVIACFCDENALILYVFLDSDEDSNDSSVLTYYISSYSQ